MKKITAMLNSHSHEKDFLCDITFVADGKKKPLLIFAHGFKGFKDWGFFNLAAEYFAKNGFVFAKCNFSHNGTSVEDPCDFVDLEAFGNNNFSIELDDLHIFLNFLCQKDSGIDSEEIDLAKIGIIGYSRGAAVAMLKAHEDERIKAVASWSGMADLTTFASSAEMIEEWKNKGVYYVINGRTKQQMPLYYQLYENTIQNLERLSVKNAVKNMQKPLLIIHGDKDETLPVAMAFQLKSWAQDGEIHIIEGANHAFNGYYPYQEAHFPPMFVPVIEKTLAFFQTKL